MAFKGAPYPPNSFSSSKGAAQNFPEIGSTTFPNALTTTKAPTIVPLLNIVDADPNPPFNWPVVAPKPAPELPKWKFSAAFSLGVAALSLKSGNCSILRGGSEAFNSNKILANIFRDVLQKNKINKNCVQFIEKKDRKIVDALLSKMSQYIDVIVPRGGKGLVSKVQKFSNIHVIGHLEGLCHIFVDKSANLEMAKKIIVNAKMRRTSICGAVETLLLEDQAINSHGREIIISLLKSGCEVRVDKKLNRLFENKLRVAKDKDWKTEYLDAIISVKTVKNVQEAVNHILKYGTMHTDSIITNNSKNAKIFLEGVNSSIAMHNVSTQFADGGEFGFGGEIGISTNKLPPRGPVGINQLTSYKYLVSGKGIIRS